MKSKKGFTLVEMLVVIVIIGILLLIAVPAIHKYLIRGVKDYYSKLEDTVMLAGRDYLNDYRVLLPKEIGNVTVVELDELTTNKYIDEVVDSNGNKCYAKVTAKKISKSEYEYYSCLECEEDGYKTEGVACEFDENNNVTVETKNYRVVVEPNEFIIEQGEDFALPYGKAYYTKDNIETEVNNKVVGNPKTINTNKLGTTTVTYVYKGAKAEVKVKVIDKVNPSIPQVVLRYDDEDGKVYKGGWYSGDIYAEFKSTDYSKSGLSGSGIDRYEISTDGKVYNALEDNYHISKENGSHSYYVRSVDKSGNISDSNTYSLQIDKEPPTCLITSSGNKVNEGNDWYIGDVLISLSSNDTVNKVSTEIFNVKNTKTNQFVKIDNNNITSNGTYIVTGMIMDEAGNIGACSLNVNIDKVNPIFTVAASDSITTGNWHKADFTITASGASNISGNTYYHGTDEDPKILGASQEVKNNTTATGTTYYFKVCSGAGLCSTTTSAYTAKLDETAPTCTNDGDSTEWTKSNRTIIYGCSDGLSGCLSGKSGGSKEFKTSTKTANIAAYTIEDKAGNTTTCNARTAKVYVDKTLPTCTFEGENTVWTKKDKTITATCSDSHSGCTSDTSTNEWSYTSGTMKTDSLSYTIRDKAGNSSTCSKTVNIYVDKEGPTTPTGGSIGSVSGSDKMGSVKTAASGSTDIGVGGITYKYIVKTNDTTPSSSASGFNSSREFTRSCGTTYYAWAIAEDSLGNKSGVKYLGKTSDGANIYSSWSSCSRTCGGGTQTRTNTCALITTELSQSCNTQSCCSYAVGKEWEFTYKEKVEKFTAPCSGTYKLEVWGAEGGTVLDTMGKAEDTPGGKGGYAKGNISLTANNNLYIVVGGKGEDSSPDMVNESDSNKTLSGGYNGGGNGYVSMRIQDTYNIFTGASGGGATHIVTTNRGVLSNYSLYKSEILIVAGGGGGGGFMYDRYGNGAITNASGEGGSGGGASGDNGKDIHYNGTYQGYGGTSSSGGSSYNSSHDGTFGCGGSGTGAGGGGYYGGGGASAHAGGGGGSGYTGGVTDALMQNGVRSGNGYAKITLESISN